MRRYWLTFLSLQLLGVLCSLGDASFVTTRIGVLCRVVALIVLEPGLILMRAVIDKFYWEAYPPTKLFWYSAVSGVLVNAVFAVWVYLFFDALRNPPSKLRE